MDQRACMAQWLAHLLLDPDVVCSNPACGGHTVYQSMHKDDLWWAHSLTTNHALLTPPNSGSRLLVTLHNDDLSGGGKTLGGQSPGG